MKSMARILVILTLFLIFAACERSAPSHSRVNISLGGRPIASNATIQAGTMLPVEVSDQTDQFEPAETAPTNSMCVLCLKSVVIHIDGAEFPTIAYANRVRNLIKPTEELQILRNFDVPTGTDRRFQILALYYDTLTAELKMQYGTTLANIANPDEYIDVKMTWVKDVTGNSVFKVAKLNGRFLTDTNFGPTGEVRIFYTHKGVTNMKMLFGRGEINNGWFSFGASENFPLTYKIADTNEVVFDRVTTTSLNPTTPVRHIAYMRRPSSFFQYFDITQSWVESRNTGNVMVGFFGDPAFITSNTGVSIDYFGGGSPHGMSKMSSSSAGAPPLGFYYNNSSSPAPDIYGEGGFGGGGAVNTPLYTASSIYVTLEQFNGNGPHRASGLQGAFSYFMGATSSDFFRFRRTLGEPAGQSDIQIKPLPGLFEGTTKRYESVKLFVKDGFDDNNITFNCSPAWLANNGFSEVSITPPVVNVSTSVNIAFTVSNTSLYSFSHKFLVCPTLVATGATETIGGMYLGPVFF